MPPNKPFTAAPVADGADVKATVTSLAEALEEQTRRAQDEADQKKPLHIKIDDQWIDLTHWQHTHPGGPVILRYLHGQDATDAFYSLHSKEAIERLKRLPTLKSAPYDVKPSQLSLNFRKFRKSLEEDGFFDRSTFWDAMYIGAVLFLIGIGTYIAKDMPMLATLLIGVGMEQAGWMGHDWVHARGGLAYVLGRFGGTINGFSSTWWSNKHNTHHVYPNHIGIDSDITLDPVFYLAPTNKKHDSFMRKFQHLYFLPVYSILYWSWRQQSISYAWSTRNYFELTTIALSYLWLFGSLPFWVAIGSVFVGGFFVGVVVTATHQSEQMIYSMDHYDFVRDQFISTRNAISHSKFVNWFWGGMQYQLEHHLFPTMPKYYYGDVAKRVEKFAKENNIDYRIDGAWHILLRNYQTMKKWALHPTLD